VLSNTISRQAAQSTNSFFANMDNDNTHIKISNFFHFPVRWTVWVLIFLLLLISCSKKDDIAVIRQLIARGAKLAENQDINGLMKMTTGDFIALPGKHDNRQVKTIIWLAFKHYRKFKILYPDPSISLQDDSRTAKATLTFLIVKKEQSLPDLNDLWRNPEKWLNDLGENADLYQLKLDWSKNNDNWQVKQARLAPFRGLGFGQ
jgi:hypothetical protein